MCVQAGLDKTRSLAEVKVIEDVFVALVDRGAVLESQRYHRMQVRVGRRGPHHNA